jgi:lipopolysaccharide transport system ATP-binding protein
MPALVNLQGISKYYPRTQHSSERLRALRDVLSGRQVLDGTAVLKDINLQIQPGQSMAVIGENGAGKSTLLKILAGVLRPSVGSIEINGSIAALLELGAGFQPDFTGLENVRMKAALLGLPRRSLDQKLEEILAFADIGDYIHEPVKHYSSGMVVRLGFAIVSVVNPQLLITDEILAVGDESFQKKCINWIEAYLDGGGTLLMVSHNMYQVQKLCKQACWIHEGHMRMQGDVFRVTQAYLAWHEEKSAHERDLNRVARGGGMYHISSFRILDSDEGTTPEWPTATDIGAEVTLKSPDGRPPVVLFGIVRADGTPVYGISSDQAQASPEHMADGRFRYSICFKSPPLLPGSYSLRAHAMDPEGVRLFDTSEQRFLITGASRELGFVRLDHEWNES